MPLKYGLRDANGNVKELNEAEYKKEYTTRVEKNMFYTGTDPKGMLQGQQPRVHINKGAGLFVENTDTIPAPKLLDGFPKPSPIQRFKDNLK